VVYTVSPPVVFMYRKEFRYDDVECLKCGNIGLTSDGHCRECFHDHKIEVE